MSFHELGDEFAGEEANAEWDAAWADYTAGVDTAQATAAPLRATLRLPTTRVELRGDLDDDTVALFADLHDDRAPQADGFGPDDFFNELGFVVRTDPATGSAWTLEQSGAGIVAEGVDRSTLPEVLWARLLSASAALDARHLHLDAPCVELGGVGVVLVGGLGSERDAVLHALLASGASYLTRDDLVLRPGTRAVVGTPTPFATPRAELGPPGTDTPRLVVASSAAPVVTRVVVGVVVVLAHDLADVDVAAIGPAQTVGQLLAAVSPADGRPLGGLTIELLSLLVAGATCVEVDASDPKGAAAAIGELEVPEARELVVPFSADGESAGASPRRFVRFEAGGLLDDGDGAVAELSADAADDLEASWPTRGARPLPEAFGLAGCPTGSTARRLWSERSLLSAPPARTGASTIDRAGDLDLEPADASSTAAPVEASSGGIPSGVAAELVNRRLIEVDDDERRRIVERHHTALATSATVIGILVDVLGAAESIDVAPVVVGAAAQAHDGPLPEHLTDVDRVDLLVRREQLELLADALEGRGYLGDPRSLSGSALRSTSDLRLHHPAHPGIEIDLHRTLAAGPFGELVDPEEFHERAVPFRLGDRWALALHPDHRFVHACVRADRAGERERVAELREVVASAPRAEVFMAEVMECSARWGATTSVLAVVRHADARFPGLPPWLVRRSKNNDGRTRRRRRRRTVRG